MSWIIAGSKKRLENERVVQNDYGSFLSTRNALVKQAAELMRKLD
jgi:hypothetical protein